MRPGKKRTCSAGHAPSVHVRSRAWPMRSLHAPARSQASQLMTKHSFADICLSTNPAAHAGTHRKPGTLANASSNSLAVCCSASSSCLRQSGNDDFHFSAAPGCDSPDSICLRSCQDGHTQQSFKQLTSRHLTRPLQPRSSAREASAARSPSSCETLSVHRPGVEVTGKHIHIYIYTYIYIYRYIYVYIYIHI